MRSIRRSIGNVSLLFVAFSGDDPTRVAIGYNYAFQRQPVCPTDQPTTLTLPAEQLKMPTVGATLMHTRTCIFRPALSVIVRGRSDSLSSFPVSIHPSIHFCLISKAGRRGTRVYVGRTCIRRRSYIGRQWLQTSLVVVVVAAHFASRSSFHFGVCSMKKPSHRHRFPSVSESVDPRATRRRVPPSVRRREARRERRGVRVRIIYGTMARRIYRWWPISHEYRYDRRWTGAAGAIWRLKDGSKYHSLHYDWQRLFQLPSTRRCRVSCQSVSDGRRVNSHWVQGVVVVVVTHGDAVFALTLTNAEIRGQSYTSPEINNKNMPVCSQCNSQKLQHVCRKETTLLIV